MPNCASSSSVMEVALPTNDAAGVLNSLAVGLGVSRNRRPPGVGIASKSEDESVSPVQTIIAKHSTYGQMNILLACCQESESGRKGVLMSCQD